MKTHPVPVSPPRSNRPGSPARARALGILTVLASLLLGDAARAAAPPGEREGDPFDLFLDRSRGDRADDEPRAAGFEVGATASLGLSSWAAPSFGLLAFVVVPFDRLQAARRRDLADAIFAAGSPKLPLAGAAAPPSDRRSPDPAAAPPAGRPPSALRGRAPSAGPARASGAPAAPAPAAPKAASPARVATSERAPKTPSDRAAPSPPAARSARKAPLTDVAADADDADEDTDDGDDDRAAPIEPAPPPASSLTPDLARGAARAACKAAKLDEAEARLDALASRAKTSALLPELRLRATRAIDETESLTPTEYDPARRTASGSATTWLEARATFRLDRLVFADDEITVERQRMARAAERARLVERVLELLDAWQRGRAAAVDPEAEPAAQARAALAIAASEASLDVLTDGWFSKAIAAAKSGARDTDVAAPRDALHPSVAPAAAATARAENTAN